MKPLGKQLVAEFIYCSTDLLNDRTALEKALEEGIRESGLTLVSITGKQFYPGGVTSIALISESHVAIHTYPEAGHASIDIFTCASGSKNVTRLLQSLKSKLQPKTVRVMEVNRGNPLSLTDKNWMTSFSGTGFEVKYYIDEVLLSKQTKYQQLDIIANKNFGRMMFLDKDLQISERDADIYNHAMVAPIIERNNTFRNVAILGGGDGGVLRETLKHKPRKAQLIEIDEDVILAAREYMPGVCGKAFDSRKAEIVLGDANEFLDEKHDFDVIIYDLTMHPESITDMDRSDFLKQIFSRIRKSLNSRGMVSLQCCSEFDVETQKLLKKLLPRYFRHIAYKTVFIPSFCENWVFASAEVR
jgi:spermidine synthase